MQNSMANRIDSISAPHVIGLSDFISLLKLDSYIICKVVLLSLKRFTFHVGLDFISCKMFQKFCLYG